MPPIRLYQMERQRGQKFVAHYSRWIALYPSIRNSEIFQMTINQGPMGSPFNGLKIILREKAQKGQKFLVRYTLANWLR